MPFQTIENQTLSKTADTASYARKAKTRVTSKRKIAPMINKFALLPIIAGVAIIFYGIGDAVVEHHYQYKLGRPNHGNPGTDYSMVENAPSQLKTQNESQYQTALSRKTTEKGIQTANVGSVIFFFGIILVVVNSLVDSAKRALSEHKMNKQMGKSKIAA